MRKALRGYRNIHQTCDSRKPISLALLYKLCTHVSTVVKSDYSAVMFKAMFLLAFHAFLRVGELTLSSNNISNVLQVNNLKLVYKSGLVQGMYVTFVNFKHSKNKPFSLYIAKQKHNFCPVTAVAEYLKNASKNIRSTFHFL